jgi:hypothetical protein
VSEKHGKVEFNMTGVVDMVGLSSRTCMPCKMMGLPYRKGMIGMRGPTLKCMFEVGMRH